MLHPDETCLILLAAGRSRRFGPRDKLTASLQGEPLALHAIRAASTLPLARRVAVTSGSHFPFASYGFTLVANDDPARGLSHSIRLGVDLARQGDCAAVLILLADMPCVTASLLERLFAASSGRQSIVFSSDNRRTSPPALIGADHFGALGSLTGDQGARSLARQAVHVSASVAELTDVDTPADLALLEQTASPATPSREA